MGGLLDAFHAHTGTHKQIADADGYAASLTAG